MITLLKKIAIRPMDDLYNIVELTNIMEGVDGAATFGYSLETVAIQVEDNQTQQYKHTHTFDIRVVEESSDSSIIDGWIASQTKVQICGQGIDGLFFMDDVLLTRNKQYDNVLASAYLATVDTPTSYATGVETLQPSNTPNFVAASWKKAQVYAGTSLFDRFQNNVQLSFRTDGSNTYQHGWPSVNGITSNVNTSSGTVTLTRDDPGIGTLYPGGDTFFMPYDDQPLIATINVVSVNNAGDATNVPEFGIAFRNQNVTNINVGYAETVKILTTGLKVTAYVATTETRINILRDVHLMFKFPVDGQSVEYDDITFSTIQEVPTGLLNQNEDILDGNK